MDWNKKPYHSLDYEMKRRFGTKVYKIALEGGMTCPNRDGTIGTGGCIFCSAGGSRRFRRTFAKRRRYRVRDRVFVCRLLLYNSRPPSGFAG